MHPQLALILAQQHIADLHRAADHNRLVQAATSSHAGPAPRHAAAAPVSFLRRHEIAPEQRPTDRESARTWRDLAGRAAGGCSRRGAPR